MASVVHCVVWVSEFAVCSSSAVAMDGSIEARPLVKNGDASMSSPLNAYSSAGEGCDTEKMKPAATTARIRSLAIITLLRSKRSSVTPASGPASIAGMARESITPLTTSPLRVVATARLKTATLLKWSPISLTTWPIHVYR